MIATVREPGGATGHDVEAEPGLVSVRRLALVCRGCRCRRRTS